ncbi:hypothetical protein M8J76_008788 [Diaphorina citri]|nr:hypothetical protein M8J76_008788 [Diaphorina citri]
MLLSTLLVVLLASCVASEQAVLNDGRTKEQTNKRQIRQVKPGTRIVRCVNVRAGYGSRGLWKDYSNLTLNMTSYPLLLMDNKDLPLKSCSRL